MLYEVITIRNALAHGSEMGLSEDFIMKYLSAIHQESIDRQTKSMTNDK